MRLARQTITITPSPSHTLVQSIHPSVRPSAPQSTAPACPQKARKKRRCHTEPFFCTKQRTYKNRRSHISTPRTQKMGPFNPIIGSDEAQSVFIRLFLPTPVVQIRKRPRTQAVPATPARPIRANPCSSAVKGFDFPIQGKRKPLTGVICIARRHCYTLGYNSHSHCAAGKVYLRYGK